MSRGVKLPRVIIPRDTEGVKALAMTVADEMSNDSRFEAGNADTIAEGVTITDTLAMKGGQLAGFLAAALNAENAAQIARSQIASVMPEVLDELRNARDLIFALHPTNPMVIVNYGFEAYTSPKSSDPTNPSEPDPGDGGGDDDPLIVPV